MPGHRGGRPAGEAPRDGEHLDLDLASLAIEGGVLMVLGPDRDPVPPVAFSAAAAAQPNASLALPGGTRVAARRVAVVLEAQARGPLADTPDDADAWIRAMLGAGEQPEPANRDELAGEAGHDVEITLFGRELLISTAAGTAFLMARARGHDASEPLAIQRMDGTRIGAHDLCARLREGAASSSPADEEPVHGAEGQPDVAAEMALPGCIMVVEDDALTLSTSWGERFRFVPIAGDDACPDPLGIWLPDGESITSGQLAQALGLVSASDEELASDEPAGEGASEGEPSSDRKAASAREASLTSEIDSRTPREMAQQGARAWGEPPDALTPDADGMVDLGFLAQAAAEPEAPLLKARLDGLPHRFLLSAGIDNGDGSWTLAAEDLNDLALFVPPEAAGAFELDVTLTTAVGDSGFSMLVACAPLPPSERLDQILDPAADLDLPWRHQDPWEGHGEEDGLRPAEGVAPAAANEKEHAPDPGIESLVEPDGDESLRAGGSESCASQADETDRVEPPAAIDEPAASADVATETARLPDGDHDHATDSPERAIDGDEPAADTDELAAHGALPEVGTAELAADTDELADHGALPEVDTAEPATDTDELAPHGALPEVDTAHPVTDIDEPATDSHEPAIEPGQAADHVHREAPEARPAAAPDGAGETVRSEARLRSEPDDSSVSAKPRRLPLELASTFAELADASAPAVVLIRGVPQQARLSAGVDDRGGSWTLAPTQLAGLRIELPAGAPERFTLHALAISIDRDGGMSSISHELRVGSEGCAELPGTAKGADRHEIVLDLCEIVREITGCQPPRGIVVGGLPSGTSLSGGTFDPQIASWVLRPDQLEGLRLTGSDPSGAPLSLRITVVVMDAASGKSGTRSRTLRVDLAAKSAQEGQRASRIGGVGFWRPLAQRHA